MLGSASAPDARQAGEHGERVTCPFCGLACDDVRVAARGDRLEVSAHGCALSARAFATLSAATSATPRVVGKPVTLDQALRAAARILRAARQPLFAGLGTDVAGMRALMRLAQRSGAVTDHMNSAAKLRNILATQSGGWITTTFAEVKNRADVIVFIGGETVNRFPRFFERLVWNQRSMFELDTAKRTIVYLGQVGDAKAGIAPDGRRPSVLRCANRDLGVVLGALAMLARDSDSLGGHSAVAGIALADLRALARTLSTAKYAVLVWSAGDLDVAHGELIVERIARLLRELNTHTRCAGLPLGGSDGDLTSNQVHVWQSGFPFRSSFARGYADYDPLHNSAARMLESKEADALLWVSSFNPERLPPPSDAPSIVLAAPAIALARVPAVFIPVATPGVHHAGHFVRSDKVVTMRLAGLRASELPSVASVVTGIEEAYVA